MGFFSTPPPPESPEEIPQPEWIGPPEGVLGGVVPVQIVLARTADVLIAATHIAVYPNGLAFEIDGLLRLPRPDHGRRGMLWDEGDPRTMLRVGLLFADGRRVTNLGNDWPTDGDPTGPILIHRGGGSSDRSFQHGYWTWPAPPPGPVVFVAEWPALSVPEARATIDGALLDAARSRIDVVWPGGERGSGGWSSHLGFGFRPDPGDPGTDPSAPQ